MEWQTEWERDRGEEKEGRIDQFTNGTLNVLAITKTKTKTETEKHTHTHIQRQRLRRVQFTTKNNNRVSRQRQRRRKKKQFVTNGGERQNASKNRASARARERAMLRKCMHSKERARKRVSFCHYVPRIGTQRKGNTKSALRNEHLRSTIHFARCALLIYALCCRSLSARCVPMPTVHTRRARVFPFQFDSRSLATHTHTHELARASTCR